MMKSGNIKLMVLTVFLALMMIFTTAGSARGQAKPNIEVLPRATEYLRDAVDYIKKELTIDGMLDQGLQELPERELNYIFKLDPKKPVTNVNYRLGYTHSHLYLYLEFDAQKITCRDRGYQNGDGIILVLSTPQPNMQDAEELIVLGFSPTSDPGHRFRKFIWKHNEQWNFKSLSDKSLFRFKARDGKVGYEIKLAWQDVYPYHPWTMKEMGFNLIFTKAVGKTQTNWHGLVFDESGKGADFQKYTKLNFQFPPATDQLLATARLNRNHSYQDQPIVVKTFLYSPRDNEQNLLLVFSSGEDQRAVIKRLPIQIQKGFNTVSSDINLTDLIPGGYKVIWQLEKCRGEFYLSVLPKFSQSTFKKNIKQLKSKISPGSVNTMEFKLQEIKKIEDSLRPYNRAFELRKLINELSELIDSADQGNDILAQSTGFVRRAFLSQLDEKLWPYTVKIPKDYDPQKKYPAIVYLHGSDSDDRAVQRVSLFIGDNFIIIAPHGRGPQNCYLTEESQVDINEALNNALKNYSIDQNKILLAGFSMGGYGVYFTHYNNPSKYKGLAVFSGHPNLANKYRNSTEYPNFLLEKYLKSFKGVPMIILHGAKDRNCEFEITEQLAAKLKAIGARVEYHVDQNVGHSPPSDAKIMKAYYAWLERLIKE